MATAGRSFIKLHLPVCLVASAKTPGCERIRFVTRKNAGGCVPDAPPEKAVLLLEKRSFSGEWMPDLNCLNVAPGVGKCFPIRLSILTKIPLNRLIGKADYVRYARNADVSIDSSPIA